MTVPDFQTIMRPTLVALEGGQPRSLQSIRTSVATALKVSEDDQAELLASGKQTRYSTGRFSAGARLFSEAVAMRLVLLDGEQFTRAMVHYKVGVSARETFELKQIDEEFFDE